MDLFIVVSNDTYFVGDIKTIFNFIYFYILSKQTKAFISKTFDGTRIQTYLATIYAADTIYEQKS